jgi:hypothetical protein
MPRVRFTSDFDCRVGLHTVRAYKNGWEGLVSQECASKAVAEDKAVLLLNAEPQVAAEPSESRDPAAPSPQPSPASGRGSERQKVRRPRRPRREVV